MKSRVMNVLLDRVLVLSVEECSISFRLGTPSQLLWIEIPAHRFFTPESVLLPAEWQLRDFFLAGYNTLMSHDLYTY